MECLNSSSPVSTVHNDAPPHVLQNYRLTFEDMMEGPALDPSKWNTRFVWGPDLIINNEEQYYIDVLGGETGYDNPFSFDSEGMSITARPITGTKPVADKGLAGGQNYSSGIITTRDSLCFTEGYVEVCARMPDASADGTWVAAWLLNCFYYNNAFDKNVTENEGEGTDKFNQEIDFMEAVYSSSYQGPLCVKNAYHYHTGDRNDPDNYKRWSIDGNQFKEFDAHTGAFLSQFNQALNCELVNDYRIPDTCDADYSDGFHTYGVDWRSGYIDFYVDGVRVNCIRTANIVTDQAMYVLINYAVGGGFPYGSSPDGAAGQLADPANFPASYTIRSVRVFQP